MAPKEKQRKNRRRRERRAFPNYMQFVNDQTGELVGDLAEISHNGFRLESSKPTPLNSEIPFRIQLPPEISKHHWIVFTARCIWTLPHPIDGRLYEVGFEIVNMDPKGREAFGLIFNRFGSNERGRDSDTGYLWTS